MQFRNYSVLFLKKLRANIWISRVIKFRWLETALVGTIRVKLETFNWKFCSAFWLQVVTLLQVRRMANLAKSEQMLTQWRFGTWWFLLKSIRWGLVVTIREMIYLKLEFLFKVVHSSVIRLNPSNSGSLDSVKVDDRGICLVSRLWN